MPRIAIHTDLAPAAIGPYSQAVRGAGWPRMTRIA